MDYRNINAVYRDNEGLCERAYLLLIDGRLCAQDGCPLTDTKQRTALAGWGEKIDGECALMVAEPPSYIYTEEERANAKAGFWVPLKHLA